MKFAFGIDISKWQGLVKWAILQALGLVDFIFIRAGSVDNVTGQCYTDYQFANNIKEVFKYFRRVGFYWFFRPNHDPVKQAKYFAALIKDLKWTLPPVVDVESNGGLSAYTVKSRLYQFITTLQQELGHEHVIIYTRGTIWNPYVSRWSWWAQFTLWVARYAAWLGHPWGDGKYRPLDWLDWGFWQFAETLDGLKYGMESKELDGNNFNGTVEDLDTYIKKYGRTYDEPEPAPVGGWGTHVTLALRSQGFYIPDPPVGV